MKKIWIILSSVLFLTSVATCGEFYCTSQPAFNNECGVYLKGFGGANWAQSPRVGSTKYQTSSGYVVGGAVGCHLNIFCLEGEFSYRNNSINHLKVDALNIDVSGKLEQWCGFANVLVGVPVMQCVSPYVGVGIGYRHINPGVNFDDSSDTSLDNFIKSRDQWGVYQAIAGLSFAATRNVNLQVEYRFMNGWANQQCMNHSLCGVAALCF